MYKSFKSISISHKRAPVNIREQITFSEGEIKEILHKIKDFIDANDLLLLSTCNRTEVYYSADKDYSHALINLLCLSKGIDPQTYIAYFEVFNDHDEAIRNLFEVALGLHSQVVGDLQITNQVKKAYQYTADLGFAGPFLHRLLHTLFFANKRVVKETGFRDGAASVSYAATALIEELAQEIDQPTILLIGLGEIGLDVCRNLKKTKIGNVKISNRTQSKADIMAAECGFLSIPFETLRQEMQQADIVVSSVPGSGSGSFISKKDLGESISSYKYFIDLGMPRSIDKDIEEIHGTIVFNIDDISQRAEKALQKRLAAVPDVQKIIDESISEFNNWTTETLASPTIQKLKSALEHIRKEELNRFVNDLDDLSAQKIDAITKNIIQKIIKLPALQLKAACKRGEAEDLIDVLHDLFDLEKTPPVNK